HFRLPLVVRANVGLFFGNAEDLIRASRCELNLVPFEDFPAESLPSPVTIRSMLAGLTTRDLEEWRVRFGIGAYTAGFEVSL
ncbi:MAG: hypothetical protein KGO48_15005, partial [Alphaproteobacteria bacterium]|nr:hypothetical protein [Alphaproteobacteria bacterium]